MSNVGSIKTQREKALEYLYSVSVEFDDIHVVTLSDAKRAIFGLIDNNEKLRERIKELEDKNNHLKEYTNKLYGNNSNGF